MLKLFFLGPPRIELDGAPVDVNRRKASALLAYLAVSGQPHSREALAALFWPDADASRAFAYLRTTLWTINSALGEGWLIVEGDTVRLPPQDGVWIDVTAFQAQVSAMPDDIDERQDALEAAAALYRDDFLAGFTLPDCPAFDDWQFFQAHELRRLQGTVLEQLVACYVEQDHHAEAIPHAQRWLALDTLHEPAHRALMQLYDASNQRAAALRQYQQCANLLTDELGVEPEPATTALFEAIQERRATAPLELRPAPTPTLVPRLPRPAASNLPIPATPFIARETEVQEVLTRLGEPGCRLLTIIGHGGIGKTRMALQVGAALQADYADGVHFVPLAPLTTADYLIPAIADALNYTAFRPGDPKTQLLDLLRDKRLLLVMDNFEHLLDGVGLVTEMLASAPGLKVLATSRERLRLQEEWVFELHGLATPPNGGPAALGDYGAVQLFVQAAQRVRPDFQLGVDNQVAVARICRLVEGMPLAVELAAAWLPVLSPDEIVQEIERSLDILAAQVRNLPPRHRSIRAVFETSWEGLSRLEQLVLSRLSVFWGGFQRDAAHQVALASLPLLLALINKSLLHRQDNDRFVMHELLRQFAHERLQADPTLHERTLGAYVDYYARWLTAHEQGLKYQDQIAALDAIEAEIDNVRAAWIHVTSQAGYDIMRQMSVVLLLFFTIRWRPHEGVEMFGGTARYLHEQGETPRLVVAWLRLVQAAMLAILGVRGETMALFNDVLPLLENSDDPLTLLLLAQLANWPSQNFEQGAALIRRVLELAEASGDRWLQARALHLLGENAHHQIRYDQSQPLFEQALNLCRELGDRWGECQALYMLGEVAYTLGHYPAAEQLYHEGLAISEAMGDQNTVVWGLQRIADLAAIQGRVAEGRKLERRSLALAYELGNVKSAAYTLHTLGYFAHHLGHSEEAIRLFEQSLATFRDTDSQQGQAWTWATWGEVALETGDVSTTQRLAQNALASFEQTEHPWGIAAAHYLLGEAALAQGQRDSAEEHLLAAMQMCMESQSIMLLCRHLVGVARLLAHDGQVERAVEIAALAHTHHASWDATKKVARLLLDTLAEQLPPGEFSAAQARGSTQAPFEIAQHFLAAGHIAQSPA